VHETGFGTRLRTYAFDDADLTDAVDRLLAGPDVRARAATASARLQQRPGTLVAADLIARVAERGN
jgi:UDP:flavonoid glycosyltransferase YjiC (YdhE family)